MTKLLGGLYVKSMHYVVLTVVLMFITGCGVETKQETEQTKQKNVQVHTVKQTDSLPIPLTAFVEYKQESHLAFGASGTIERMNVTKGAKVTQGQVLSSLNTNYYQKGLEAAQSQVQSASALRSKTLQGASADLISKQRLAVDSQEKRMKDAQRKWETAQELFKGGAISQSELDSVQSEKEQNEISLQEARITLEKLLKGAEVNEIASADADLKQAASEVELAKKTLQETQLVAPFSGTVIDVTQKAGSLAQPGESIIHLVDSSEVKLKVDVPLDVMENYKQGDTVPVAVEGKGKSKGTITFISPVLNQETGKYLVEIAVSNKDNVLIEGMVATVEMSRKVNGMLVPVQSVGIKETQRFVMVVENGVIKRRDVEVGQIFGNNVEILSGLQSGNQILISGITYYAEGEDVTVKGE
ncbi:efflux RND transporter periplasmic adaptor subunit [Brevibacillus porteri]|uniref:efflux RND transporter periplasmic adaptor subunit n=2 Tax=Brevibacillus porteri TaxID=2126350 RepID=UPI002E24358A|nr:efflux RND transporter periplasmic adaptor subunit [Brevibacillus porteri]MED2131286.1 efflux RND transporter periplasmic adaptor subunit [Brevibacillus porteri]